MVRAPLARLSRVLGGAVMLALAAALPGSAITSAASSSSVTVTVSSAPLGTNQMAMGLTHTQYDLDAWNDPAAVASATNLMRSASTYQNQAMMGWGADNPEPAPGQFNWGSLDARMQMIGASGGIPVITLCCAPDWMKGGQAGTTDWTQLTEVPQRQHYGDFANLAAAVAQRYPGVTHYIVWNELKGLWGSNANRWDYEDYTALYNQVYDALKAVNPAIQVGGPYVVMDNRPDHQGASMFGNPTLSGPYGSIDPRVLDVITYWLAHKHGADFITIDGMADIDEAHPFAVVQAFADVTAWLKAQTNLPVWWSEWYATPFGGNEYPDDEQNAVLTATLMAMARSGVAVPLRWQPQADPRRDDESLWTDTREAGGGQPLPFYWSAKLLHDDFPPGTPLLQASVSAPFVGVLASSSHLLAVNESQAPVTVVTGGHTQLLPAYGVSLIY